MSPARPAPTIATRGAVRRLGDRASFAAVCGGESSDAPGRAPGCRAAPRRRVPPRPPSRRRRVSPVPSSRAGRVKPRGGGTGSSTQTEGVRSSHSTYSSKPRVLLVAGAPELVALGALGDPRGDRQLAPADLDLGLAASPSGCGTSRAASRCRRWCRSGSSPRRGRGRGPARSAARRSCAPSSSAAAPARRRPCSSSRPPREPVDRACSASRSSAGRAPRSCSTASRRSGPPASRPSIAVRG